ncbi:nicotinamide-nucleotide adenylyltransferase, NadR type [Daejeonella lutea]|uniref:Nicotinamide-nucleotide adenylyltransferase, NadR type n=2 Tax=Daejeonella lutea TaxID=572036 RepID=A0A1T5DGD7_9SPHI|nr:nicotinamide-nucleotide adenylyltransferase, NadR type [Daejeonella lutea]
MAPTIPDLKIFTGGEMISDSTIKKIAIVGPESTGKSTISAQLADHYHTVWVPEYAREYCSALSEPCTWQDEINMFRGQLELESKYIPLANKILICDTTFITVKIWSDHMFGESPKEVTDHLHKHPYDLYLLMDIDLAWEEDPLRDFPHMREHFMEVWHNELKALDAAYHVISGTNEERLRNAIRRVDSFLNV